MKIVMIADTHERHLALEGFMPEGDVLVCAGDFTMMGEEVYVRKFDEWLGGLPYQHKVVIPGNHELSFDEHKNEKYLQARNWLKNAILLVNQSAIIDGMKFYGMPDTPEFCNWAFNRTRTEMEAFTDQIPADTDVLVTHGPPFGICDALRRAERDPRTREITGYHPEHLGCLNLLEAVERVKPKVHVFGHIHGAYGKHDNGATQFFNASICNEDYRPTRQPQTVTL